MKIFPFTKMQSLGNDFVVIDAIRHPISLTKEEICLLADRRYGIGCDQILLVKPAQKQGDFSYHIFNADGSAAEHCGNGARCLAKFVYAAGLSDKESLQFELISGHIITTQRNGELISVDMGPATLAEPLLRNAISWIPVSLSNPHAITTDLSVEVAPLKQWGEALQKDVAFTAGVNVTACAIQDLSHLKIMTYERGVGITPACGSGACAAVFALYKNGKLKNSVTVQMPGGNLMIECLANDHILLIGPTTTVFTGMWNGKPA